MMHHNLILFLIFMELELKGVLSECPVRCKCEGAILECYKDMPKFIPPFIKEVVVHEAVMGKTFDFGGSGWTNITSLSINPGLTAFHNRPEAFRTLNRHEFVKLQNLEKLQIACKCLAKIRKRAFYGLNNLKSLDLSNNPGLSIESVIQGLKGNDILPKLSELYLSNTSVLDFDLFLIGRNFFNAVKKKQLTVLDISNTGNAWFQWDIGLLTAFPYLEKLNISAAGLVMASLMAPFASINLHPVVSSFTNLKILDISYPSVPYQVTDSLFGENMPHEHNHMHAPHNLTELYAKRLIISSGKIHATSNSTHLCFWLIPRRHNRMFCYIGNGDNLEKLVLAENLLQYIEESVWKSFPNLHYLDVSSNELGDTFSEGNARYITSTLKRLKVLILSNNGIYKIQVDTFHGANALEILDLSINKLDRITFSTDNFYSLKKLDLRNNKFTVLDELSLYRLSSVFDHPKSKIRTESNELLLEGNPLLCSCENIQFLKWLISRNVTYTCSINKIRYPINEAVVLRAKYFCKEQIVIAVFAIFSVIVSILVTILIHLLKRERKRASLSNKTKQGISIYSISVRTTPPVFLSFCSEDDETVMAEILPNLERGLKKVLNTESQCVSTGYSEFRPGFCLANEIIRCIEASSVVIFFVTNAFCRKMWCRSEALTAHYENKPIVLMLWENIDIQSMPKHLYKYYAEYVSVHWIQENGQRVMKPDWEELCAAVVRLFIENAKNGRLESISSCSSQQALI